MKSKLPLRAVALGVVLGALQLQHPSALADVLVGTGAQPSRTLLGASNAVAFRVSDSAPGHHLMFPYFTVQKGQMTVLHLINSDLDNGKAVKLRFRGAGNADSLLSLQVLLSAGDTWTAAITSGPDGRAQLTTADSTCTYPPLAKGVAQPFLVDRLNPAWSPDTLHNNTREGTVEAMLMADVPSAPIYGAQANELSSLYRATRLINTQSPCTPAVLDAALSSDLSSEAQAAEIGFATPSGGLSATWYIIDVPGSTTFSGVAASAIAVDASGGPARGNFVVFPQTGLVVLQPERYTADPLLVSAGLASRAKDAVGSTSSPTTSQVVQARFYDLPDLSTPYYLPASAVNARQTAGDLSARLATTTVLNQYAKDANISAQTDWVFATPTKRYSVAYDYSQPPASAPVYSVVPPGTAQPQYFFSAGDSIYAQSDQTCQRHESDLLDRDGTRRLAGGVFLGSPPPLTSCGVVAVLAFDRGPSVLSSSVSRWDVSMPFTNGWMSVRASGATGKPVIGAALMKLTNPNATPGVAANYGIAFPHVLSRQP